MQVAAVTADDARNLVRQANLTEEEVGKIMVLINSPSTQLATLSIFEGLHSHEVAATVRAYLEREAGDWIISV